MFGIRALRRALIVHPMHLGDVVTTLPLAGVLKKHWPEMEIHFCGVEYARPLIECCTHIDAFIDVDAVRLDPDLLRSVSADIVFNPYPFYPLLRGAKQAKIPIRVGNLRRPRTWRYCNRFVAYGRAHSPDHTVDIVLKNLRALNVRTCIAREDLRTVYGLNRLESLTGEFAAMLSGDRFNLIIHPKSGGEGREWPASHFAALVSLLPVDRCRIFVTGVAREGDAFRRDCPGLFTRANVVDLMGRLTLKQFIALAARMDGIVASGTGPLHIAAALGIHALGIYPPTVNINAMRWGPIGPKAESLCLARCPRKSARRCEATPLGPPCACTSAFVPARVLRVLTRWIESRESAGQAA